eukprot:gene7510-10232_t
MTTNSFKGTFWKWTTQSRPNWKNDPYEAIILCTIFGITGSSSVLFVRPALKYTIGLEGSLMEGPNSYRVLSLLLVSPIYSLLLFSIGTICGRHNFVSQMSKKILNRFIPSKIINKWTCPAGKEK